MKCYFIRVNGQTLHDDPKIRECYVGEEPNEFKRPGYSNYLNFCLKNNIVRMGWPAFGDLNKDNQWRFRPNCYHLPPNKLYIHEYLEGFKNIQPGSVLVVPDRDRSGKVYMCEVVKPYWFESSGPYECSHRVGVKWDQDNQGRPICYTTEQLGITKGGWWLRAFHEINDPELITVIKKIREHKNVGLEKGQL